MSLSWAAEGGRIVGKKWGALASCPLMARVSTLPGGPGSDLRPAVMDSNRPRSESSGASRLPQIRGINRPESIASARNFRESS